MMGFTLFVGFLGAVLGVLASYLVVETQKPPVAVTKPKSANLAEFVARDLAKNPGDWAHEELGTKKKPYALLTHKSGLYIVRDENATAVKLIKPTGFENFDTSGLGAGVHAWHLNEARKYLGVRVFTDVALDLAMEEVNALSKEAQEIKLAREWISRRKAGA